MPIIGFTFIFVFGFIHLIEFANCDIFHNASNLCTKIVFNQPFDILIYVISGILIILYFILKKLEKADNNITKTTTTQSKNKQKFSKSLIIGLFITTSIFAMSTTILGFKYYKIYQKLDELDTTLTNTKFDNSNLKEEISNITNGYTVPYIKDKLNYFDNMIVFIIDGYKGYYFDYDAMKCLNEEDLKGEVKLIGNIKTEGYRKYQCK